MGKRLSSQDSLYNDLTMGDKPIAVHESISPGFECPGHTHSPGERAWSPRRGFPRKSTQRFVGQSEAVDLTAYAILLISTATALTGSIDTVSHSLKERRQLLVTLVTLPVS